MSTKKQNRRIDLRRTRHKEKQVGCEAPAGKMLGKVARRGTRWVDKDDVPNMGFKNEE